jgi:hypothetical protein
VFGVSVLISLAYERVSDGSTRLSRSQHRTSVGESDGSKRLSRSQRRTSEEGDGL